MRAGVRVIPLTESADHLRAVFDNPFEIIHAIAAYDPVDDVIVFNADHPAWLGMGDFVRSRHMDGFYSSPHPQHVARHEVGHALHHQSLREGGHLAIWTGHFDDAERQVAERVSRYAGFTHLEFVAEVYAGRRSGIEYDDQVRSLYVRLGGPEP